MYDLEQPRGDRDQPRKTRKGPHVCATVKMRREIPVRSFLEVKQKVQ